MLVRDLDKVVAVAAGASHSLAVRADGSAWAWGNNRCGQLGDGTDTDRRLPVAMQGLRDVVAVTAEQGKSLFVAADRTLWWCCHGQYSTERWRAVIAQSELAGSVAAAAMGSFHHAALLTDGTVATWGANISGQLGDGTLQSDLLPPERREQAAAVPGLSEVTAIAAGGAHTLALRADGSVWAWGANYCGQLGDGTNSERPSPVPVAGLDRGVVAVAADGHTSFALREDGAVLAWGYNYSGRLGYGGLDHGHADWRPELVDGRLVPAEIAGLGGPVVAIAPQVAVRADGSVVAWGGSDPARAWGADAVVAVGTSKLGGRPDLPKGMRWPRARRRALCFVAQVDLAGLPAEHTGGLLPPAGLLSFFCGDTDDLQPGLVVFTESGTPLRRLDYPKSLGADNRFNPVTVEPTAHLSLPSSESALLAPSGCPVTPGTPTVSSVTTWWTSTPRCTVCWAIPTRSSLACPLPVRTPRCCCCRSTATPPPTWSGATWGACTTGSSPTT